MGALIFRCPVSGKAFRSEFRASLEDLKAIPRAAKIQLNCEICKERHAFVLAECAIDEHHESYRPSMSALGQKQTYAAHKLMSAKCQ